MSQIFLRVLDGADRGRAFDRLVPPFTIGREQGNAVQLNDERVSRFHVKIQEDHEKVVLTDLESTNGTKVNGEDIQLRILRYGDIISLGRSVLLYGSRDQIAKRLAGLRGEVLSSHGTHDSDEHAEDAPPSEVGQSSLDFELNFGVSQSDLAVAQLEPPQLPDRLTPGQAAQLAELLSYFHVRVRSLIRTVHSNDKLERVTLDTRQWQMLVDFQARLAEYLRQIGEPDSEF